MHDSAGFRWQDARCPAARGVSGDGTERARGSALRWASVCPKPSLWAGAQHLTLAVSVSIKA